MTEPGLLQARLCFAWPGLGPASMNRVRNTSTLIIFSHFLNKIVFQLHFSENVKYKGMCISCGFWVWPRACSCLWTLKLMLYPGLDFSTLCCVNHERAWADPATTISQLKKHKSFSFGPHAIFNVFLTLLVWLNVTIFVDPHTTQSQCPGGKILFRQFASSYLIMFQVRMNICFWHCDENVTVCVTPSLLMLTWKFW